ncbi:palmitoyltransferase ZDHHC4 [Sceloporus undulatus]|uniref:palmitoyltransferase ZDHHC4 n=1 Tax=Sceloporus undulatus TaxID=8520 RepID=UPI001C4C1909|nr:palmitoyltransferase ZDHHC4 [Sceloporus undulatus]XP_042293615.1 palmitoyltransferase ZDHHC4 [Sceloporus undulatus]
MDFLVLFLLYVGLVVLSFLLACVYFGKKQSFPSRIFTWTTQVISYIIPAQVQGAAQRTLHGLFHTRNSLFVVLHLTLEALVYGEFTWEVFGYCEELEIGIPSLLLPYLLLIMNTGFFILCSKTDPGKITKSNQAEFLSAYPYDGVMFEKGVECPTCQVRKPARSKHCGACNVCVHRFDHHCVWVNNCIGAFNARYFIIYLLTLTAMAVSITALTATFLIQVVILSNLMLGHYTDDHGQEHPIDAFFLIQHLFLTFPRIVFMLGFVVVHSIILAAYFCFILYLVLTNQTSNEWFKSPRHKCSCPKPCNEHRNYENIYSRGVWGNIAEIARPSMSAAKKRR